MGGGQYSKSSHTFVLKLENRPFDRESRSRLEGMDILGHNTRFIVLHEKREFALCMRGRNGCVGTNDRFSFGILQVLWIGRLHDHTRSCGEQRRLVARQLKSKPEDKQSLATETWNEDRQTRLAVLWLYLSTFLSLRSTHFSGSNGLTVCCAYLSK
jgi:hypothetical protein